MARLFLLLVFAALANRRVLSDDTPRIMQMAISAGNLALLEDCLKAGIAVDGFSEWHRSEQEYRWGSLALAVAWKQPRVVKWLLDHGADPSALIDHDRTAFDLALEIDSKQMLAMFHAVEEKKAQSASRSNLAPLIGSAPTKPAINNRHVFLCADVETAPWKLTPAVLSLMLRHGLDPLSKTSSPTLASNVFLEIASATTPEHLRVLLESRNDWNKQRELWRQAAQEAYWRGDTEITRMLEVAEDERLTDGLHISALEVLLKMSAYDKRFTHAFVSFNDTDPPESIMRLIRGHLPNACNHSLCVTNPSKQPTYRHQHTGKSGNMVQLRLVKTQHGYDFYVRNSTAPAMAGSGTHGTLILCHGHWIINAARGWEE